MSYQVPVSDILHTMAHIVGGCDGEGSVPDLADGTVPTVVEEAGRFARDIMLPLDRVGDRVGISFSDGSVTTAPGWPEAYRRWVDAGWNGLSAPVEYGGQGLSLLTQAACSEIWSGANLAFSLCPLLTASAIEALAEHGDSAMQQRYLPKLVSGVWTGTMNMTEPQAGSDLGTLRTRAERADDGAFRITGQKIFISYGEHDLAQNIVHLVLARLPDAAPGSRGISLFLVPKFLVNPDGSVGERNDLLCTGIERKLGMHAAPTCTMQFGQNGGATGYLIGQEGRGLNAMFTMMNQARLAVGLEGVGAAERATQQAIRYARERRQGRAPGDTGPEASPIIRHPDVARMCLTMRALTAAARALCYLTAHALDTARTAIEPAERFAAADRAALLTPVAKAFSTDVANEVASMNVQVHGGMGYIEEAGAAQVMRDIRIAAIYEGTNGIQALDLVGRKLGQNDGAAFDREVSAIRRTTERVKAFNGPGFGASAVRLSSAIDAVEQAAAFLRDGLRTAPGQAIAGASPFLRLFGLTRGSAALADGALGSGSQRRIALCRFFAEQLLPAAPGLAMTIVEGAGDVADWQAILGEI